MRIERYDIVEGEFKTDGGRVFVFRGILMDFISREEDERYFPVTINDLFGFYYTNVWLMNVKFLKDGKFLSGKEVHRIKQNYIGPAKLKICRVVLFEKSFKKKEYEVLNMCL
jgi:hypothetical protein